ncbi:LamG-like jellyroll fold domain-containing protein [Planctomicrobium sp. SH661]|uniref:LamG-like jellyroll fold domain-containing protein n=1 Tax=Planctomicrobium sp. SH661 TaxID=3448124 RepID=UPI003F5AE913
MNHPFEFREIVQAYVEGRISPAQMDHLNSLLRDDPHRRAEFIEMMNLNSGLTAIVAGSEISRKPSVRRLAFGRRSSARNWIIVATLCCVLVSGAILSLTLEPQAFATVKSSTGVESMDHVSELRQGWQEIDTGVLELVTSRGAHLVIEAPARFRFESAQRLHLERGRIAADVPPSAKRFTVVTPTGEAVDLGTKFGVDVPVSGESEVHVFQGEVIAQSSAGGKRKNLYDGDAFRLQAGAGAPRDLRSAAFIRPDEVAALHAAIKAGQPVQSSSALEKLRSDPSLIALLDFEGTFDLPGQFNMVQGRWPGSRAPEFMNIGDHIKLHVGEGQHWPQLTLAAWVRLDRFGEPYQSLLHTDGWYETTNFGQVHWMVTRLRTMRLALAGNTLPQGSPSKEFYPDSVTPVPSSDGRWVHLATVYDSDKRTVRFFLDGKFDTEVLQLDCYPAVLGPAQIGNWNNVDRRLSGRIDELVLLGRAMSDAEIQSLFDAGNPYR